MSFINSNGFVQTCLLPVGEPLPTAVQDRTNPVQGITLAAPMPQRLLLDPPTDVVNVLGPEFDDVEGIKDSGGIVEGVIDGVLIPLERIEGRDSNPCARQVFETVR